MNIEKKVTMIISTCQRYSDLWNANILLLNQNWADRKMKTILLTDAPSESKYPKVDVFSAGEQLEWSERLAAALKWIETEYVLLVLDDFFFTKRIYTKRFERLITIMDQEKLDYIRLASRPWAIKKYKGYKDLYEVDLDRNYAVNLLSGIWRKSFLEKTIQGSLNAWEFEVSLTEIARNTDAKCVMSKGNELPTMDVVRKGKLSRRANRYFKKNPIYQSQREVVKWKDNIATEFRVIASFIIPKRVLKKLKGIGKKHGMFFYSD